MNEGYVLMPVNPIVAVYANSTLEELLKIDVKDIDTSNVLVFALTLVNQLIEERRFDDIVKGFSEE